MSDLVAPFSAARLAVTTPRDTRGHPKNADFRDNWRAETGKNDAQPALTLANLNDAGPISCIVGRAGRSFAPHKPK
jgi:hypothetical protein